MRRLKVTKRNGLMSASKVADMRIKKAIQYSGKKVRLR
jgi:hypothetical protein